MVNRLFVLLPVAVSLTACLATGEPDILRVEEEARGPQVTLTH